MNISHEVYKISIVLPAKNEAGAIQQTVKAIKQLNRVDEIIVVNDGSTDDTAQIAEQAGAKVISHPYSKGNGAAIKAGVRNAIGDVIVFMDADGQHDANDILKLIEKIEQGYDLVVGARQKGSQASMGRGIANKLYNNLKPTEKVIIYMYKIVNFKIFVLKYFNHL